MSMQRLYQNVMVFIVVVGSFLNISYIASHYVVQLASSPTMTMTMSQGQQETPQAAFVQPSQRSTSTTGVAAAAAAAAAAPPAESFKNYEYRVESSSSNDDEDAAGTGVAMCVIQKWGTAEIDDWVNYHWSIGFTHFVFYDNSDSFELERWGEMRQQASSNAATENSFDQRRRRPPTIEAKHWPGLARQQEAYKDCAEHLQQANQKDNNKLEWVGYMDLDEFLVLKKHDNVVGLLRDYCPQPACGALTVNYILFGSNGETGFSPLPQIKRFQYRAPNVSPQFKTLARISSLGGDGGRGGKFGAHCFPLLPDDGAGEYYDTAGPTDRCPRNVKKDGLMDVAVIHHIFTKSREEWNTRCTRGSVAHTEPKRCGHKVADDGFNVFDDSAWQILKRNMPQYQWYDDNAWMFGRDHPTQYRESTVAETATTTIVALKPKGQQGQGPMGMKMKPMGMIERE